MPRITLDGFREGLLRIPGVVLLTLRSRIDCTTRDRMVQKGNPFLGRVFKIVTANGGIGADYERAVRKARGMPEFVAGPRAWGDVVNASLIYYPKKDRWYVQFIQKSRKERWYLDNRLVDKAMFTSWLKPPRDEDVIYRNFAIDKFLFIRWGGQTYRFTPEV